MDHQTAVDQNLTERYVLGELNSAETAEFEAHFFECALCAEDIRQASRLVANLRAVLREGGSPPVIEIGPNHEFVDLTIRLKTPLSSPVECEFQCGVALPLIIVASPFSENSIYLRLPTNLLPAGPCTVILRNQRSRDELERRQLMISKNL